jgi:hypothetical protein
VSRTTEIRHALAAAVATIAPEARAFAAGRKYDGQGKQSFALRVLVGDPGDEVTIERLDRMLDDDGEESIKAALNAAPTLGGIVETLWVVQHRGHQLFPVAGGVVLGAEWTVDVT